jgi:hypothetical protein
MAIVQSRKPPHTATKAIGRALLDLRGRPDHADQFGGAELNLSQPLPVYRLGLEDIEGPESIAKAKHIGWRYLIEPADGGAVAYADVKETGGGDARFTSLSRNRNAERLMEAAQLAEKIAKELPGDCEARILDVPAIYISAIWLTGNKQIFIPYIDGKKLAPAEAPVRVEPHFPEYLVQAAQLAKQHFLKFPE